MKAAEARGLGELAGGAAADVVDHVAEMHAGIARRAFGAIGPVAIPVRVVHDAIANRTYAAVRVLTRSAVAAAGRIAGALRPPDAPSIETRPAARIAIGAFNGALTTDGPAARGNPLILGMTVRSDSRDVEIDPGALSAAFPAPTGRVALFLHGLCETDDAWRLGAARSAPYGERLRSDLGYTPVYVRYNTGRRISSNGRELAALLDRLVAAWPVAVEEIALVGHSMGGLLARSACHYGRDGAWTPQVRHVVTLGAPHRGARLEQAATVAGAGLALLPETRSLARALARRSDGIKDLSHGWIVDEPFGPGGPLRGAGRHVPHPPAIEHLFICATVTASPEALAGRFVGDLLVLRASAWDHGGGERLRFALESYAHVGPANHFDLLNHPAVYEQMRRRLAGGETAAVQRP